MANREFIAAKDLPVTEAEKVNVLVVDPSTGELAQKAGANLGGGEQTDLVIRMNRHPSFATASNIEIVSGSVEAVYDVFESGAIPKVDVEVYVPATVDSYIRARYKVSAQIVFYGDLLYINAVAGGIFGENPCAFRIEFDSTTNYALTDYICKTVTTA